MAFVSQKRTSVGKWLLVKSLTALTAAVFLCEAHQDCFNGGTWKNGACLCNDGFTGKFCEKGETLLNVTFTDLKQGVIRFAHLIHLAVQPLQGI